MDEPAVIAHQPQERMHEPRYRPVKHRLHLLLVHRHAGCQDHMAELGHLGAAKRTFGALHEQLVLLQRNKDEAHVLEMLRPRATVDEDVIEEVQDEAV
jgi:hypothetical protein